MDEEEEEEEAEVEKNVDKELMIKKKTKQKKKEGKKAVFSHTLPIAPVRELPPFLIPQGRRLERS